MSEETFTQEQINAAINQFLDYGEKSFIPEGEFRAQQGHKGYFSGNGWAATCLRYHFNQLKKNICGPSMIRTNHKVGDVVWFMFDNKPREEIIAHIEVKQRNNRVDKSKTDITTYVYYGFYFRAQEQIIQESLVFSTKAALLESL